MVQVQPPQPPLPVQERVDHPTTNPRMKECRRVVVRKELDVVESSRKMEKGTVMVSKRAMVQRRRANESRRWK
jgi:hypothetical protein